MIAQADSRKWMARLYNSFLFMEAKIMKMAKKLLASSSPVLWLCPC